MIVIDGSMGEGGGQILRTALALAALLGKEIKIVNIRAKRPRPGLQRQHMVSVRAVAELSNAKVEGLRLGSTEIVFRPGGLRGGSFRFDIGTAGSITLVLQAIMPIAAFAPSPIRVEIRGGTDVPWSPPIDYIRFVFSRILEKFGYNYNVHVKRRGHYPKGGGIVVFEVAHPPRRLNSAKLDFRGEVKAIEGISHAVKLPRHVAERQARSAEQLLRSKLGDIPIKISIEWYEPSRDPHLGPGSGIVLWAYTERSILGGDSLGARGKPAEKVGSEAAERLYEDLLTGKALDRHASDMVLPYAALACGTSLIGGARLTLHAWTNIELIKKLVPEAKIKYIEGGNIGKPFLLNVEGICLSK
ncbi:RNA 3'-terminal phosphate cyclase [Pyrofollis japonicus]|uniref:RNA 3'-terminal phosphate cyclase n=1 Tax=Pyrofollis japonicus TaxID=3060460 RepID=UPI00295AC290|nr:RNA 3'-terminal phosphate cyclase [Pyrofollis japonicus]BEP18057.1 RNA 3'-terminal phosphate cyclase [Pyrofollis japonicus]